MLTGSAVMDAALLLIAANEPCPQPQTKEHLAAVEVMKLSKVLILQNKVCPANVAAPPLPFPNSILTRTRPEQTWLTFLHSHGSSTLRSRSRA